MQGRSIVIVAYRPKPGKEQDLLDLTREHVAVLRRLRLATDRESVVAQAADGTIVEVFEWEAGAIERAHTHPEVGAMWARYAAACDIVPLGDLPEGAGMFAGFAPLAV